MSSVPEEVLQWAERGVSNAKFASHSLKATCIFKEDAQTNEAYLFIPNIINDPSDEASIKELREGKAVAVDVEGRKLRSLHGKEIEVIHLSGTPFVVFKVTDFP
jgi:hypothetical protein